MSTQSMIVKEDNGSFHCIYCHFDGYPDCVGEILHNHYQDDDKINELINLGDLSCLGAEIGEKHPFDSHSNPFGTTQYACWCLAYGRDRGEEGTSHRTYNSIKDVISYIGCSEYIYLWKNNEWYVTNLTNSYSDLVFVKLSRVLDGKVKC